MLKDIVPPSLRRPIYAAYALIGFIIGTIQVAFSAAEISQPVWMVVVWAVYGYAGTAIGATALGNTNETTYDDSASPRHGIDK